MVDQIYYKVQYPLKRAIDLMKDLDNHDLDTLVKDLNEYDRERVANFIENWNNGGREKLTSLVSDLRSQQ